MPSKLTRDELQRIAKAQKFLLWTILLAIFVNLASMGVSNFIQGMTARGQLAPEAAALFGIGMLVLALGLVVLQISSVIRLCLALKEGWATGIYVIFQFAPCINLILLLFLNGRATSRLKEAGIRVGIMGANSQDLQNFQPRGRNCQQCGEALDANVTQCPLCGALQSL